MPDQTYKVLLYVVASPTPEAPHPKPVAEPGFTVQGRHVDAARAEALKRLRTRSGVKVRSISSTTEPRTLTAVIETLSAKPSPAT